MLAVLRPARPAQRPRLQGLHLQVRLADLASLLKSGSVKALHKLQLGLCDSHNGCTRGSVCACACADVLGSGEGSDIQTHWPLAGAAGAET